MFAGLETLPALVHSTQTVHECSTSKYIIQTAPLKCRSRVITLWLLDLFFAPLFPTCLTLKKDKKVLQGEEKHRWSYLEALAAPTYSGRVLGELLSAGLGNDRKQMRHAVELPRTLTAALNAVTFGGNS